MPNSTRVGRNRFFGVLTGFFSLPLLVSSVIGVQHVAASVTSNCGRPPTPTTIHFSDVPPDDFAFCQIAGPTGLGRSERIRLGLTLIAPGTDYPAHAHPAVETYLVIAGTALAVYEFWVLTRQEAVEAFGVRP